MTDAYRDFERDAVKGVAFSIVLERASHRFGPFAWGRIRWGARTYRVLCIRIFTAELAVWISA